MDRLGHQHLRTSFYVISALVLYFACLKGKTFESSQLILLLNDYGYFFLIGVIAATIANSTGAGGGIVFLPAFLTLGLTTMEALATSFAIQCFGMTSGALAWLKHRQKEVVNYNLQWKPFSNILVISLTGSLIGILSMQWLAISSPIAMQQLFACFSLLVAMIIFYRIFALPQTGDGRIDTLKYNEKQIIFIASLISGAVTAWISIGIGEVLAVTLILMGFRVHMAITAAVCVSSLSVLAAVPYHIFETQNINFDVLLFAAPGAIIGGKIARKLAVSFRPKPLKLFMASWIAISALGYLI